MELVKSERGQILVQVALMLVVLFAFVALALDVGHVYAGRRRMQNAADAGALAGARAICSGGSVGDAEVEAQRYAERNGAEEPPQVDIVSGVGTTVTVVANQNLETFFAGVIGIGTADVQARAAAVCGPQAVGSAWPLAFEYQTWEEDVPCGSTFVVWDLSYDELNEMCVDADKLDDCNSDDCGSHDICDKYGCDIYGPALGTGNYNWLALPADFPDDYSLPDDPLCKGSPTGASWLKCWLTYRYPPVLTDDMCIWTEPGGIVAAEDPVTELVLSDDPYRNIALWDDWCTEDDGTGRSEVHIVTFGCVEVLDYHGPSANDRLEVCQCDAKNPSDCESEIAITARKICEEDADYDNCFSPGGQAGGAGSEAWAVSLVE